MPNEKNTGKKKAGKKDTQASKAGEVNSGCRSNIQDAGGSSIREKGALTGKMKVRKTPLRRQETQSTMKGNSCKEKRDQMPGCKEILAPRSIGRGQGAKLQPESREKGGKIWSKGKIIRAVRRPASH